MHETEGRDALHSLFSTKSNEIKKNTKINQFLNDFVFILFSKKKFDILCWWSFLVVRPIFFLSMIMDTVHILDHFNAINDFTSNVSVASFPIFIGCASPKERFIIRSLSKPMTIMQELTPSRFT